jgi:hypothetical protein
MDAAVRAAIAIRLADRAAHSKLLAKLSPPDHAQAWILHTIIISAGSRHIHKSDTYAADDIRQTAVGARGINACACLVLY